MSFIQRYVDDFDNPGKLVVTKIAEHCRLKYADAYGLQAYDFRNNKEIKDFIERYNEELRTRYISENGVEEHLLESTLDIETIMQRCKNGKDFRKALVEISDELERLREANNMLIKANQKLSNEVKTAETDIELKKAHIDTLEFQNKEINNELKEQIKENNSLKRMEGKYLKYINNNLLYAAMLDHFVEIGFLQTEPDYSCSEEAKKLKLGVDGNAYEKMKDFFLNYDSIAIKVLETPDRIAEVEDNIEEANIEPVEFRKKWAEKFANIGDLDD
ncbi:hypothetical protein SAMN04487830_10799 [Pseudobutyrivibrio sp. OR37]|nr:hypothetical protein SAMN04487830_10799 [Pseudobutyrivibrio sp. OR37]